MRGGPTTGASATCCKGAADAAGAPVARMALPFRFIDLFLLPEVLRTVQSAKDRGFQLFFAALPRTGRTRVFERSRFAIVEALVFGGRYVGRALGHRLGHAEADETGLSKKRRGKGNRRHLIMDRVRTVRLKSADTLSTINHDDNADVRD